MESSGSLSGTVLCYWDKKKKAEKIPKKKFSNEVFEKAYLDQLMPYKSILSFTNFGGLLSTFDPVLCEVFYS